MMKFSVAIAVMLAFFLNSLIGAVVFGQVYENPNDTFGVAFVVAIAAGVVCGKLGNGK